MADTDHLTPLSRLLTAIQASPTEETTIEIPDDWLQGRAIYGGLSAALCLQSVLSQSKTLPPLRSAQLAFVAPAGPGVILAPRILREGKSAVFAAADMCRDDGAVAARATFCFGRARPSKLSYADVVAPDVAEPEAAPPFFEMPDGQLMGPEFARHFDSRHAAGALPMGQAETPEFVAWMRHRDPGITSTAVALAALADALPPAAMACFDAPAPVSSMTWQFDMLDAAPQTTDGWWLCRSAAEAIDEGYAAQTMTIWNRDCRPILVGRQQVAVFY
ncbi:acyl-CoA thioesterase II [Salinisphaera sp. Q1T1-3]|uniref:acyl-CoA thioesterase n=1 Tax=Salinisphaera sp. Q1T1-3 TaxID=2321229 RepID=UPI000E740C63|nr:thioesterase family protein [Salinisphaera sp. Q1T1-3]RJS94760.1 thioesterase family protein [Salinisphaera sp. Q1T1-3]